MTARRPRSTAGCGRGSSRRCSVPAPRSACTAATPPPTTRSVSLRRSKSSKRSPVRSPAIATTTSASIRTATSPRSRPPASATTRRSGFPMQSAFAPASRGRSVPGTSSRTRRSTSSRSRSPRWTRRSPKSAISACCEARRAAAHATARLGGRARRRVRHLWHPDRFDPVTSGGWDRLYSRVLDGVQERGGRCVPASELVSSHST